MTNEITKNLVCILMRSGIEVWVEQDRLEKITALMLTDKLKGFVKVGDKIINTSDISGIFPASVMEEQTRRKNGEWKCRQNYWHNRGEKCEGHPIKEDQDNKEANILMLRINEARDTCTKCENGFIGDGYCECVEELVMELNQYGKTLLKK